MILTDLVGYMAALMTTVAFIPQALMTWKHKHADGVSLGMYIVFTIGIALWLIYGICMLMWPVIVANTVTLILASFILAMKIIYK
jgi:MtN3 and saliva related transmembrane protein